MITKFNDFMNEGLFGGIARLRPGDRPETRNKIAGRMKDDNYAVDIYNDMVEDFEKYGRDLRKVMVIDNYKISYVFGKYDVVKNSPMTGNYPDDRYKKTISVTYIGPEILINRNSLEKSFGVSRGFKLANGRMKIEEIIPNPNYDPDFNPENIFNMTDSERERYRTIDTEEESFKISHDIAKDFVTYFIKEYDKQYPQLKKAKYKNLMSIKEIEQGNKPSLGYVDVFDKEHNEIVYAYYDTKDKKKIEKYIKNHVCLKGRNKDHYPITYFTLDDEPEEEIKRNMEEMSQSDVNKQNMERVNNYK